MKGAMKSNQLFIKLVLGLILFPLTACQKKSIDSAVRNLDEQTVLEQSAFYPNQQAPEAELMAMIVQSDGETGTIGGPDGGGAGGDGGSIPGPGTGSDGSGSTGGTGGDTAGGSDTGTGGSTGDSSTGGDTDVADGGSSGSSGSNGGTDGGANSGDGDIGSGSDGGTIGDNGGSTGGDGGAMGDGSGSDGSDSGSGVADGSGNTGGDGGGSDGSGSNSGSDTDVADGSGNNGDNDGGDVGNGNTDPGSDDGGNVADNGGDTGTDGGSSNSGGDTDVADGGSSSGGSTDGNTSDGDGSNGSGGNSNTDGGTDVADGSDSGNGSDGGTIGGGDSGDGSDGGTVGDNGSGGNTDGGTGNGTDDGTDVADGSDPNDGSNNPGDNGGADGNTDGGTDVADGSNPNGGTDGGNNPGSGNTGGGSDGGTVGDGGNGNTDGDNGGTDVADGSNPNDGGNNGGNPGDNGGGSNNPGDGTDGNTDGGTDVADGSDPNGNDGGTVDGGDPTDPGTDDGDNGSCQKVDLCHIPPGNPSNAHTINISENAVDAHLAHGDVLGACPAEFDKNLRYKINRVCSQYRSRIPYPQFIFFEEALNPILSVEASVMIPASESRHNNSPQVAMPGLFGSNSYFSYYQNYYNKRYGKKVKEPTFVNVVVKKVDLNEVDLFEGRHMGVMDYTFKQVREQFPQYWENAMVTVRVCDDSNRDGKCSDEVGPRTLSINHSGFTPDRAPRSVVLDVWHGRNMLLRTDPEYCEKQYSPIVLDLAGNGIELTGPGSGVEFDINDEGKAVYTGWTGGIDDAFLVNDVNKNGVIDNGSELFGSATRLKNGERASDGFAALREHDDDGDGLITPKDAIWRRLRLWLDKNHNGRSDKGEIFSMSRAKMESINLNYIPMNEVDQFGNETRMRSTFRRTVRGKSTPMLMVDVWFNTLKREEDHSELGEELASN